ncbi:hypothetical protein T07_10350 [Trichinella nelsoni]|uniref:Uncharacterized protein n=1 Tax=Trichinella nelsoni TaxID=6336 RepID=A0A0V0SDL9_9BILA|nr:hypothetical protein T07_10350 [Trichinella nelsoni]
MQRYYCLTISLDVSIAVYHVPSSAPLSGLPHRQSKNEFDASEEYLRGLDTQYNVLQWLVEPADMTELFWSSFRSRYRGMSGSSIFLNFPIFLNVSIAVNHVPSTAPLSGLTHRQSNNEFDADVPKVVCQNSVSADSVHYGCGLHHSLTTMLMSLCVCLGINAFPNRPTWLITDKLQLLEVAFFGNCVIEYALLESVTACLNDVIFYYIHLQWLWYQCFEGFPDRNMAMQTATLPLTESHGKRQGKRISEYQTPEEFEFYKRTPGSTSFALKGQRLRLCLRHFFKKFSVFQKFSPRRCLRLRLRANKICILPLGYAKGDFLHNI